MPVTLNNTTITIDDGTNNFVLETVKTHVPEQQIIENIDEPDVSFDSHLIAWYKFDTGNDLNYDTISQNNLGILYGTEGTNYDRTENAIILDGIKFLDTSDGLLEIDTSSANNPSLNNLFQNDTTITFWGKLMSVSAPGQNYSRLISLGDIIIIGGRYDYSGINISVNASLLTSSSTWIDNRTLSLNTFYFFTILIDVSNNKFSILINSNPVSVIDNLHISPSVLTNKIQIGNATERNRGSDGIIDDFRIYNRVLTQTEVSNLYNYNELVPAIPFPDATDLTHKILTFTHDGSANNQTEYTVNFPENATCDILIVGGGGGGGRWREGGGGGDVLYFQGVDLSGTYNINVGKGGDVPRDTSHIYRWGGFSGETSSITGGDSSYILNVNAGGGGGAGGWEFDALPGVTVSYTNPLTGNTETSSGGGAGTSRSGQTPSSGNGVSGNGGQGDYDGWENSTDDGAGGGGGGGGTNGNGGLPSGESGGLGGDGETIDITGSTIMYGKGGNGWGNNDPQPTTTPPNIGQGGAGTEFEYGTQIAGGSGIVIIRYNTKYIRQHPAYDAQWTYHSANPNVHHYGNVGIGTLASETNKLTVKGDINVIGDIYENNNKIAYGWNVSGNSVYNQYGNVGIGTNDPRYALHTTGIIYAGQGGITETGSTTWTITSDNRIKDNIEKASYDICSENIKNINLYRFNYNDKYVKTTDKNQLGFIAQDVRKYFPKAVKNKTTKFDGEVIHNLLSVDVTQLNYAMYGAVKHIGQDIDAIKEKLGITEVPTEIKNEPYVIEVVPFNDPDAELPIVNEEPATN